MPQWSVSEPYINLWVKDVPLAYQPARGPAVQFKLAYKLRENTAGFLTSEFSTGKRWNFSWLSYVRQSSDSFLVHLPNGGMVTYGGIGAMEFFSNTRLENFSGGYRVIYADGSTNTYEMQATVGGDSRYYLTEMADPAGQKVQLHYEAQGSNPSVARLLAVVDADGRTNTIQYATSGYSTNLIVAVVDPWGRTTSLNYDASGCLTNVVDPMNLPSFFAYQGDASMTNLTTPYGTTTFSVTEDTVNQLSALQVTDAGAGQHLWLYRATGASGMLGGSVPSPNTEPYSTSLSGRQLNNANSFYWGPRQVPLLTHTNDLPNLTADEFLRARRKHWLGITNHTTLSMMQDFSPDGSIAGQQTWLDYDGGSQPVQVQPLMQMAILPDGETWFARTERNGWGTVTNLVDTWSAAEGRALRTNRFEYSADGFDLLAAYGVDGELVGGYGYQNHVVKCETNAFGEATFYTYNDNGQRTSRTSPSGLVSSNFYFASGYTGWLEKTVEYVGGQPWRTNSFTYANGLVETHIDERGLPTTSTWDALSRLTSTRYPDGTYVTNLYQNLDLIGMIDRMGFGTFYVFDALRRLVYATNALQGVTHYTYCPCGSLESMIDPLNHTNSYFYDQAGRLMTTLYSDGYWVTNNYDLPGRLTGTGDSAGATVSFGYNNQGLRCVVSNAWGVLSSLQFDAHDRVVNRTDANGVTVETSHDLLGRVLSHSYPDSGVESFGYTANIFGATSYTNQLSQVTRFGYDAFGRKTAQTNANLEVTRFEYTPAGDLHVLTDGKSQHTTWNYDIYGRATNKVDHSGQDMFRYAYDADGRMTNRWTPAKGNTGYSYDAAGNLQAVHYPQTTIGFAYDCMSHLTNMVDAVGTTTYGYNAASQLLSEDGPWASDTVSYTYNNRLRASLSVESPSGSAWTQNYGWDTMKRIYAIDSPAGSFGYQYTNAAQNSAAGTLVSMLTLPNGAFITNKFDSVARLLSTELRASDQSTINSHSYQLNHANQRTRQTFTLGNYVDYGYDDAGQLNSASGHESGGAISRLHEQLGYRYDPAGNLQYRTNNALIQTFDVNGLNELTNASRSGTFTVAGLTTSAATNVTVNAATASVYSDSAFAAQGFSLVDGTNIFTAIARDAYGRSDTNTIAADLPVSVAFSYDLNGNLTGDGKRCFAYDDENQLVSVWVTNSWRSDFVYDGKMRRRIRREYAWQSGAWSLQTEVRYVYDGNLVVQERNASNRPQVTYTRGKDLSGGLKGAGGIGGMLARTDLSANSSQSPSYYHCDGGGNISCLINANQIIVAQYRYNPYGNILSQSGPLADANLYRFSSKEFHLNSEAIYYLYRYYFPSLQRWLSRDPIQESGGWNLYNFLENDSPNAIDPLGWSGINVPPDDVSGPGPLLPGSGQVPPGHKPSWPTGIGDPASGERPFPYVEDPTTGRRYWPDPETPRQWPHYNWRDPDGTTGHYPEKCDKTWPNQRVPPFGYQSLDSPWPKPPQPRRSLGSWLEMIPFWRWPMLIPWWWGPIPQTNTTAEA